MRRGKISFKPEERDRGKRKILSLDILSLVKDLFRRFLHTELLQHH